jgi:hypothetical protein
MKRIVIHILILLPVILVGQYQHELNPITNDVIRIEQIHFNGIFRKSGWKSIYEYLDGRLLRTQTWYKGDLRSDEKYKYLINGGEVTKEKIGLDSILYITIDSISEQQLKKRKIFLSQDSINPSIVLHSYIYNSENIIDSYKSSSKNYDESESTICIKFNYLKNKIVIQELSNCENINKTITMELDKKGSPIFETIDHHDKTVVITGGRSEKGIQRYKYKYDKKGNWTKRYYVTSKGNSILEIKRKIKYK